MSAIKTTRFDPQMAQEWASEPSAPPSLMGRVIEGVGIAVDANSVGRNLGLTLGGAAAGAVVASLLATGILATFAGTYHSYQAAQGVWKGIQERDWTALQDSSLYLVGSLGYAGVGVGATVYGAAFFAGKTAMLATAATTFLSFSTAMGVGFAGLGAKRWKDASDFRKGLFEAGGKVGDFEFTNPSEGMKYLMGMIRPTKDEVEAAWVRLKEKYVLPGDNSPQKAAEFLNALCSELKALHKKGFERLAKAVGAKCAKEMKDHWEEVVEGLKAPSKAAYWLQKAEKGNYVERSRARFLTIVSLITIVASLVSLFVLSGPAAPLLFGLGAVAWFLLFDCTALSYWMADLSYRVSNWEDQMRLDGLKEGRTVSLSAPDLREEVGQPAQQDRALEIRKSAAHLRYLREQEEIRAKLRRQAQEDGAAWLLRDAAEPSFTSQTLAPSSNSSDGEMGNLVEDSVISPREENDELISISPHYVREQAEIRAHLTRQAQRHGMAPLLFKSAEDAEPYKYFPGRVKPSDLRDSQRVEVEEDLTEYFSDGDELP